MTSLRERFTADLKEAMKAGEKAKVSTIRLITSALEGQGHRGARARQARDDARRDARPAAEDDQAAPGIDRDLRRQRPPRTGRRRARRGRGDRGLLPKQMSRGRGEGRHRRLPIAESGAASVKDMGKVIAILRANYAGQMDFGKVEPAGEGRAGRGEAVRSSGLTPARYPSARNHSPLNSSGHPRDFASA